MSFKAFKFSHINPIFDEESDSESYHSISPKLDTRNGQLTGFVHEHEELKTALEQDETSRPSETENVVEIQVNEDETSEQMEEGTPERTPQELQKVNEDVAEPPVNENSESISKEDEDLNVEVTLFSSRNIPADRETSSELDCIIDGSTLDMDDEVCDWAKIDVSSSLVNYATWDLNRGTPAYQTSYDGSFTRISRNEYQYERPTKTGNEIPDRSKNFGENIHRSNPRDYILAIWGLIQPLVMFTSRTTTNQSSNITNNLFHENNFVYDNHGFQDDIIMNEFQPPVNNPSIPEPIPMVNDNWNFGFKETLAIYLLAGTLFFLTLFGIYYFERNYSQEHLLDSDQHSGRIFNLTEAQT